MVLYIIQHHIVGLTAFVGHSSDLPTFHHKADQGLQTKPVYSWPVIEERGRVACCSHTCCYFSGGFFWVGASLFFGPLRSLNVPCATCGKSPSEGNPFQSGQMHHTQNTCVPYVENGPLFGSCTYSTVLSDQAQEFLPHETQGLMGTASLPQE